VISIPNIHKHKYDLIFLSSHVVLFFRSSTPPLALYRVILHSRTGLWSYQGNPELRRQLLFNISISKPTYPAIICQIAIKISYYHSRLAAEKSCDPWPFTGYGLCILNKTVGKFVSISGEIVFVPEVFLWARR